MFTNNKKQTRGIGIKSLLATAVTAALIMTPTAKAVDGSSIVKGHVVAQAGNDLTGATITLKHKSKGKRRSLINSAKKRRDCILKYFGLESEEELYEWEFPIDEIHGQSGGGGYLVDNGDGSYLVMQTWMA